MMPAAVHTEKPLIIPVFIPHMGCPHQCAFCNQHLITKGTPEFTGFDAMHETIRQYLKYQKNRSHIEVAFFGGNFLGLDPGLMIRILDEVEPYISSGPVSGIRFSTRPDTIHPDMLDLIRGYPIRTVELGIQSMDDTVLQKSRRGHTAKENEKAIFDLKETSVSIGVQLMTGLPGDSEDLLIQSTKKIAALQPDFARIYPLLVFDGSPLAAWYRQGRYQPQQLETAVTQVARMYGILTGSGIRIIRMGLQASDFLADESNVLAGPWHPAFGHLVLGRILYEQCCMLLDEAGAVHGETMIQIRVHPRSESRLRGNRNKQIHSLKERYPGCEFEIVTDRTVPEGTVRIR